MENDFKISAKKMQSILQSAERMANAIHLVYVHDTEPGIQRVRKGNNFEYWKGKILLKNKDDLARIKALVIPPAWENVWICCLKNGHLQAAGTDQKARKQYKYHQLWSALRNQTKFYRLYAFGNSIAAIRQRLEQDLGSPGMPLEKVLAAVVCLLEQTSIRIGNSLYEKLYGSFGLTTLQDRHVKFSGDNLRFSFKGKKGIQHNISLKNKRLARIIKNCRDIPGKALFQYYDANGSHQLVDSGMVNHYIKAISGQDFTAKDFRTWAGTVHAIAAFRQLEITETPSLIKKNIVSVYDEVAGHLGNTRAICKKYYVHPVVITLYESGKLNHYFNEASASCKLAGLAADEQVLMAILKDHALVE